jgi:alginate O-acetyltransferase complex protein AlgI
MSFGSPQFLFIFMPLFYIVFFATPKIYRNGLIFVSSLVFYWIDAGPLVWVLFLSVVVNHFLVRVLVSAQRQTMRHFVVFLGIILNLFPLFYYKYWIFIVENLPLTAASWIKASGMPTEGVLLPVGISFFTFQGISYLVDVYRRDVRPADSVVDFGMYHTMFPQLIAGPIVRYVEVANNIRNRSYDLATVHTGIVLLCLGLGCKIVLADNAGVVADKVFALAPSSMSFADAWLGISAYTLQIFFDFSGYSTMAIGLGMMLGFHFPQNFDQPYRSQNITEFWRRWHMTLSRWFRDYLYIPLGGNRAGPVRTYLNLALVFVLCGLWHGAAVTFLVWGAWHGLLLVIERILHNRYRWRPSGLLGWAVTMLLVMIGWVFFRSPTIEFALAYLHALAGFGNVHLSDQVWLAMTPGRIFFLFVAGGFAVASYNVSLTRIPVTAGPLTLLGVNAVSLIIFIYSLSLIAANGFNPFIYFRF